MLTYPHRPDQELASEEWQERVALFWLPGDIVIHGPATTDGLLDLRGLAFAALARRRGLTPATDSVYLPLGLISG